MRAAPEVALAIRASVAGVHAGFDILSRKTTSRVRVIEVPVLIVGGGPVGLTASKRRPCQYRYGGKYRLLRIGSRQLASGPTSQEIADADVEAI
jgi:hypothetical protein